ncbi:NnrU family protein [Thalassobius sp. Cn5-15]|uniref:NnrU family protein n=1 Tax=Thalassobius sp. Cn5-15 TaxID=2917763 RepID=UPI001EF3C806|nr:NnrU family protein [Thalassobius sp. Cn5-15]MCG7494110.1 NnrU family protein [Thalassobius sp. Cn5-15]
MVSDMMIGWAEYIAAFILFFVAHNLPTRPAVKTALLGRFGKRNFGIGYGLLSLIALYWLLMAAGRAPVVELWHWAPWQNLVPLIVMAPVCMILCFGIARPNPFSFGGRHNDRFDPTRAGIIRLTRHPVLAALALWSAAHTVPNGQLAHALLFGIFTLFALLGMRLIDRRNKREDPNWQAQLTAMQNAPLLHIPSSWADLTQRLMLTLGLYMGLLHSHGPVLGAYPIG